MAVTDWLIDKSALVRLADSPDAEEWADRIQRGLVRTTNLTRLEIGYSARNEDDARSAFSTPPVSAMPVEYLTPAIEDRAPAYAAGLGDYAGLNFRHFNGLTARSSVGGVDVAPYPLTGDCSMT